MYAYCHYNRAESPANTGSMTADRTRDMSREIINLRASADQKALIDRAAALLGKSRTEFMLDSARQAAVDVLLDRRLFALSEADQAAFIDCLDAPVEAPDALKRLLSTPAPWER